jgi:hypothetical protein
VLGACSVAPVVVEAVVVRSFSLNMAFAGNGLASCIPFRPFAGVVPLPKQSSDGSAVQGRVPVGFPSWVCWSKIRLIFYGPDYVDQFRQHAAYVDRILKGEKPADLSVQTPTKYQTVINLKTQGKA